MAEIALYKIEFVATGSTAGFVVGDVLDVYAETDDLLESNIKQTIGIFVKKNGVLYTDPVPDLAFGNRVPYTIKTLHSQLCKNLTLVKFILKYGYPFVDYLGYANNSACLVDPDVCNLLITDIPVVVNSSLSTAADGSISVTATSRNDIQFKLNADFVFDDGSAQSSGFFSGLLAGKYTIYLRDSKNCQASVLVSVEVAVSYAVKYRLTYDDYQKRRTRIDILMQNYEGEIIEVKGGSTPFVLSLRGEGEEDKFISLVAISAILTLTSEIDNQFNELYTNDPDLYRIHYYKNLEHYTPTETSTIAISLPPLSTWIGMTTTTPLVDWVVGAAPYVTLPGSSGVKTSELIYCDYDFIEGYTYVITVNYTKLVNSGGGGNQRTSVLSILDSSFNVLETTSSSVNSGAHSIIITFVSTSLHSRVAFSHSANGNVTITINSTSGTETNPDIPTLSLGFVLQNSLKILPQLSEYPYTAPPYYFTINATDGLSELKNNFLIQPDGWRYYGQVKLIKLIAYCLSVIKLDLEILVGCNLFAVESENPDTPSVGMSKLSSDDPLDQSYVDYDLFYLQSNKPDLDFVLRVILDAFGAKIIQANNRWSIVRTEEMCADYAYRLFDKNGDYITNGTFESVVDIDYPAHNGEVLLANQDHSITIKPGYGFIRVVYFLGLRDNILRNGDFKTRYEQINGLKTELINRDNWSLSSPDYPINESLEIIDNEDRNVALKISASLSIINYTLTGGSAFVKSSDYFVKMGASDQIKIAARFKISVPVPRQVPYIKFRCIVKYGSLYLTSDGDWSSSINVISFFITETNVFQEIELTGNQPKLGTPVDGMDMSITVFHAYPFYSEYHDYADIEAIPTYDSINLENILPTEFKIELRDGIDVRNDQVAYYELQESTASPNYDRYRKVVRPADYHVTNNPRQWIFIRTAQVDEPQRGGGDGREYSMSLDKVSISFLTNGNLPLDTIIRTSKAEDNNDSLLEKLFFIGSYSELIVSEKINTPIYKKTAVYEKIQGSRIVPKSGFNPKLIGYENVVNGYVIQDTVTSSLSSQLVYSAYIRNAAGEGYEFWQRNGVAEEDKLHGIQLKSYAAQYKKSWKVLSGSFYAKRYFTFVNVLREVNDSNRLYLPMSLSLDDKRCMYSGDLYELKNIFENAGSDGTGEAPYSSGFSIGWGGGFN